MKSQKDESTQVNFDKDLIEKLKSELASKTKILQQKDEKIIEIDLIKDIHINALKAVTKNITHQLVEEKLKNIKSYFEEKIRNEKLSITNDSNTQVCTNDQSILGDIFVDNCNE